MRARGTGAALALSIGATLACSGDTSEAERAVRAYDEAASAAYRTRDPSRLRDVATEREWRKVVVLVDLKTANRLVLESELQALRIEGVQRPGPDGMVVRTQERWRYQDRPLDPGKPPGTVFVAEMTMEYELVRLPGGPWKVDGVRALSNEFVEPKGFRLDGGHGRGHGDGAPQASGSR